jgi:hypothetical protein
MMRLIRCSVQGRHLSGGLCLQHPEQLVFRSVKDFKQMRSLRNPDGSWMRLYHGDTTRTFPYLSGLKAVHEGLWSRAVAVGVSGI